MCRMGQEVTSSLLDMIGFHKLTDYPEEGAQQVDRNMAVGLRRGVRLNTVVWKSFTPKS